MLGWKPASSEKIVCTKSHSEGNCHVTVFALALKMFQEKQKVIHLYQRSLGESWWEWMWNNSLIRIVALVICIIRYM